MEFDGRLDTEFDVFNGVKSEIVLETASGERISVETLVNEVQGFAQNVLQHMKPDNVPDELVLALSIARKIFSELDERQIAELGTSVFFGMLLAAHMELKGHAVSVRRGEISANDLPEIERRAIQLLRGEASRQSQELTMFQEELAEPIRALRDKLGVNDEDTCDGEGCCGAGPSEEGGRGDQEE